MRKPCLVAESCLTLCDPMDCSPPSSSVHGILQAGRLEWVAISFSRRSSQPRDWTCLSCIAGVFSTTKPCGKSKNTLDKPELKDILQSDCPVFFKNVKVVKDKDQGTALDPGDKKTCPPNIVHESEFLFLCGTWVEKLMKHEKGPDFGRYTVFIRTVLFSGNRSICIYSICSLCG